MYRFVEDEGTILGSVLFISSGIYVVAGKYLYGFFSKLKEERLAIIKFNCAIEGIMFI